MCLFSFLGRGGRGNRARAVRARPRLSLGCACLCACVLWRMGTGSLPTGGGEAQFHQFVLLPSDWGGSRPHFFLFYQCYCVLSPLARTEGAEAGSERREERRDERQ